jgi:hypothetical protein
MWFSTLIKSATNNNGNFDEKSDDIRFKTKKNLENSGNSTNFASEKDLLDDVFNEKGEIDYDKVADVAERIFNRTAGISRFDRKEEAGRIAGGKRNVEASIVAGAHQGNSTISKSGSYEAVREEVGGRSRIEIFCKRKRKTRRESLIFSTRYKTDYRRRR